MKQHKWGLDYQRSPTAAAKSLQSCPTLCDPIDGSPPGSPVPGILRQEHWSGLPFPSPMHESKKVKVKSLSRARLFETPWTAAYQAPPFMGFSRQEYWSGVPLPSPYMWLQFTYPPPSQLSIALSLWCSIFQLSVITSKL